VRSTLAKQGAHCGAAQQHADTGPPSFGSCHGTIAASAARPPPKYVRETLTNLMIWTACTAEGVLRDSLAVDRRGEFVLWWKLGGLPVMFEIEPRRKKSET